ncbi:MAG: histidinol-phosphatase [Thermogutta sp.]|nr:histidinol-phosphatase [Thermogutta sp.]
MRRFWLSVTMCLLLLLPQAAIAQVRSEIAFPDIPGYVTLKCDFHMHTVFSDGLVWPTVRVDEAFRTGLDAIALSDHIEYQPHKDDIPTKHNRSYELAAGRAKELGILLIRGAEITRDTPPGHFNAIFLKDAVPLEQTEFVDAVKAANEQGAFVFWNHQAWKGEELGRWLDVHTTLYENKWLHGMEVCNGGGYYPTAHRWCLEKNLVMIGNSDIHVPDLLEKNTSAEHRTITLVFASERSVEAIHEALRAGRTAVWWKDKLIGRPEWLEAVAEAVIQVEPPHLRSKNAVWFRVRNLSEMDLTLDRKGDAGPTQVVLPARSTVGVRVTVPDASQPITLDYTISNFWVAPDTGLQVTYTIPSP